MTFIDQLKDYEVLVTYLPANKIQYKNAAFLHVLHFAITFPKTLERYYVARKNTITGYDPELIFNSFVWDGLLKVNINSNKLE